MEIFSCRILRSSAGETSVTLWSSMSTRPALGVSRPLSIRMRVDLPEPDRPMTTKVSPGLTSKVASMTAAVPSDLTSSRGAPSRRRRTASWDRRPNTLYTLSARNELTLTSQRFGWGPPRTARRPLTSAAPIGGHRKLGGWGAANNNATSYGAWRAPDPADAPVLCANMGRYQPGDLRLYLLHNRY